MFKLTSIRQLAHSAALAFKRFPLSLSAVIAGTVMGIYLVHLNTHGQNETVETLSKLLMCCYLGLTLFLSLQLLSETKKLSRNQNVLLQTGGIILLIIYYFSLGSFKDIGAKEIVRFALYAISLHLLVAYAPFIKTGNANGFWQYNKTLFIRFLTSALYSGVLYIGLALALLAIDNLFKVEVNDKCYFDLWLILAGIFNTWFFLAGIPTSLTELNTITEYPKGLKIFTQFVLLPLVAIYLIILYAYSGKIAIEMELPKGWVSNLIIGYAIAGILSFLLIWPLENKEEHRWIKASNRFFYILLLPLIVLLALAIYVRIGDYGITENRYFIVVIALWLTAIALYFLFSKSKNIKLIPISLCIITLLSSFGPWGAFSISETSQVNRLEKLLIEEKLLVDGKIQKSPILLRNKNTQKIVSILDYLDDIHGYNALQPWFTQSFDTLFAPKDSAHQYVYKKQLLLDLMGVDNYYNYYGDGINNFHLYAQHNYDAAINVKGFDYYQNFNFYQYANNDGNYKRSVVIDNDTLALELKNNTILIYQRDSLLKSASMLNLVRKAKQKYSLTSKNEGLEKGDMQLQIETDSLLFQLNFTGINIDVDEKDSITVNSVDSELLIKRK